VSIAEQQKKETIMEAIDITKVTSVYSGKDGKCCCGCSGKHYEASSEKMVRKVVKLINSDLDRAEQGSNDVSLVVGDRIYIAYFD
jgi:acyl-CoA hydrolase